MAKLILREGGVEKEYPLGDVQLTVGRGSQADIELTDSHASRRHCTVEKEGDSYVLRDLGSTNGTLIGRTRVGVHKLRHGDEIVIGAARLSFDSEAPFAEEPAVAIESDLPQFTLTVDDSSGEFRTMALKDQIVTIGRSHTSTIVLQRESVSGSHAELRRQKDGSYELVDLESKNGTWIAGEPVRHRTLRHGDDVTIAGILLRFRQVGEPEPPAPEPVPEQPIYVEQETVGTVYGEPPHPAIKLLSYVAVAVAILGVAGYLAYLDLIPLRSLLSSAPPVPEGNLVRLNPSFEEAAPSGIPGWTWFGQPGDTVEADSSVASHGTRSVTIVPAGRRDPVPPAVLMNTTAIVVDPKDTYSLRCKIDLVGSTPGSFATFRLSFSSPSEPELREEVYTEPLAPPPGWTEMATRFSPPVWATEVRVGCAVFGSARVRFDDITVRRESEASEPAAVRLDTMAVMLGPRTELSVSAGSWQALWDGEVVLLDSERHTVARQTLARSTAVTSLSKGGCVVRTSVLAPQTGKSYDISLTITPQGEGVQFTLPAAQSLGEEVRSVGFQSSAFSRNLTLGVVLASPDSYQEQTRAFGPVEKVRAAAWGSPPDQIFLIFSQPVTVSCTRDENSEIRMLCAPDGDVPRSAEVSILMKPFAKSMLDDAGNRLAQAARDEKAGKAGAALAGYHALIERYFYLEGPVAEARKHIPQLTEAADALFARAGRAFERAQVTLSDSDFAAAADAARTAAEAFAGTPQEEPARKLLEEITGRRTAAQQKGREAEATALLARGNEYLANGQRVLAGEFYQQVIDQFPNTEWSKTAEEARKQPSQSPGKVDRPAGDPAQ